MKKIIISLLLVLMMVMTLMPMAALADDPVAVTPDTSWYAATESSFTLNDAADLLGFAQLVNGGETFAGKTVSLGADIDLAGIAWTPIGDASDAAKQFMGEFNGAGKTISNLTQISGARVGMFSMPTRAYIHDLVLKDVVLTLTVDDGRIGALAGNLQHWNVVENVTINGVTITVTGNENLIGSVAGYVWKSQLNNVDVVNAKISTVGTGNAVGGNVGYVRGHVWDTDVAALNGHWLAGTTFGTSVVQNLFVNCDVNGIEITMDGGGDAGGFVGSDTYNYHSNYFVACTVSGLNAKCTNGSYSAGGFMGYNKGTTSATTGAGIDNLISVGFNQCSASGTITGDTGVYGGFVGTCGGRPHTFGNASADVDITCNGTAGGFVGMTANYFDHLYSFNGCTANGDVAGDAAGGFAGCIGMGGDGSALNATFVDCAANGKVNGTTVASGFIAATSDLKADKHYGGNVRIYSCTSSENVTSDGTELSYVPEATGNEVIIFGNVEADVNGTKYITLQEAVAAAPAGATVTVLQNIVIEEPEDAHGENGNEHSFFYVTIDKKLTLDLNGKTIKFSDAMKEKKCTKNHVVFCLVGDADVTITGNGTIDSFDGVTDGGIGVWLRSAPDAKLTIENGTFYGHAELLYISNGGNIVINGGRFENNTGLGDGHKQLLNMNGYCQNNKDGKSITMYGGTVVTCDPRFFNDGNMVAEGYLVSKTEIASTAFKEGVVREYTVIPNDCRVVASVTAAPADYDWNHPGHTADFGEFPETVTNYYTSLEAAQAVAKDGDIVTEIPETDRVEHKLVESTVAPTCTDKGYKLHTCSVCGYNYKDTYVDAAGHHYVNGKCDVCGAAKPYSPPAHSHSYTATVVAPTCTEQGYTLHKCSCGASYKDTYVKALGHDYKDGVCTRCEAKDPNYVPPHEHSYTDVVTAPTCLEKGFTTHTCACGDVKVDTYVDALGHDYKDGVCTRCGAKDVTFNPFKDVDKTTHADYYDAILWAYYNDITKGTNAAGDMFSPELGCTRAQIVTFLWRQSGAPVYDVENPFTDVSKETHSDYYNAIMWAYKTGVIKGISDTEFAPDKVCTRAEIVTMLYRLDGENAVKTGTQFTDLTQAWYKDAIAWAVAEGITKGTGDTTFTPDAPCTRAQTVTFLYRYFA